MRPTGAAPQGACPRVVSPSVTERESWPAAPPGPTPVAALQVLTESLTHPLRVSRIWSRADCRTRVQSGAGHAWGRLALLPPAVGRRGPPIPSIVLLKDDHARLSRRGQPARRSWVWPACPARRPTRHRSQRERTPQGHAVSGAWAPAVHGGGRHRRGCRAHMGATPLSTAVLREPIPHLKGTDEFCSRQMQPLHST